MAVERVNFDSEIQHLVNDEEFRRKLFDRMDGSNGWGFSIRHKGLRIDVTAIDGNFTRKAYLEA